MTDAAVSDDHDANCVPALWAAARRFLGRLIGLCGAPCVLVTDPFLSLKERRGILHWLRPVESLVRRLLVAEAVRIAETRPSGTDRRRAKVRRPVYPFCRVSFPDPENPATWAVRFSVSEPSIRKSSVRISPRIHVLDLDGHANVLVPAARNRAIAQHRERMRRTEEIPVPARMRRKRRPRAGSPWPLARRIEALTRVLENPELYARRLARRLRKNRDRLFRVCRPPPLLPRTNRRTLPKPASAGPANARWRRWRRSNM
ncbi:MAG: hypothetical protein ACLFV8_11345 [Alphaproteobacteria bacterium]